MDWLFLCSTLAIAVVVFVLDYIIPVIGTKKFGGSKAGMIGTTIGLLISLIFPILGLLGIIVWPFIGALVGELINRTDRKTALKSAFGSFLGFLTGTFMKFLVATVYLGLFISIVWDYKGTLFTFFN